MILTTNGLDTTVGVNFAVRSRRLTDMNSKQRRKLIREIVSAMHDASDSYIKSDLVDSIATIMRLERENSELLKQIGSMKDVADGFVVVPTEPSRELLMSMAIRFDHGLGCPGYYDSPMVSNGKSHQQRLESTIRIMRQLHEEVVGRGFYSPN